MNRAMIHGLCAKKIKRCSDEDESLIAAAEMPELKPVTPELLFDIQTVTDGNRKVTLQCCLIFVAAIAFSIIIKAYTLAFTFGISLAVLLVTAFILHLRAQIDETAVMMTIPVHSTFPRLLLCIAVCYLPDGKYHIRYSRKLQPPAAICYVEYGKFTYWKTLTELPDEEPEPKHESTLSIDE